MINAHPRVQVAGVCDTAGYMLDVLRKYTGVPTYSDFKTLLREARLDAVIIATPSSLHAGMTAAALDARLHVFCEKPFSLDTKAGEALTRLAAEKGVVNQVGYHNRFVAAFREAKRLVDAKAIGEVTHVLAEAYGPVVLRPRVSSWRTQSASGGGCLYDYAAHPIDLLNWYLGAPKGVGGTILHRIFSADTDDEVFCTLYYESGTSAQLSVNWSEESYRKMSTSMTIFGTAGRIYADRQECRAYLRDTARLPAGYKQGWNVRYTTELTEPVWFYMRGEEYSAQLDYFVQCIEEGRGSENVNSFAQALMTDKVIAMMAADAAKGPSVASEEALPEQPRKKPSFWNRTIGAGNGSIAVR
jgi:predicted dehydrogenase